MQEEKEDGEESWEGDKSSKIRENSRHVSHGCHMVRGKMEHGMEDYVVAKKQVVNGKEIGLYAIFDGHSGRNVAEYLQNHLFDSILSQVYTLTVSKFLLFLIFNNLTVTCVL